MKYVRTKEGIYKNASIDNDIVVIYRHRRCEVEPYDIVATADTIEELCDFAYALWEDNTFEVYDLSYDTVKLKDLIGYKNKGDVLEIKYGIKTDKGLMFVAEPNDNGGLKLL